MTKLIIAILVGISLHAQAQSTSIDSTRNRIQEIYSFYNSLYDAYDTARVGIYLRDLIADNFALRDHTMGFNLKTKELLRKYLYAVPKQMGELKNFKSEIKDIFFISPYVADVFGVQTGVISGKPFKTNFSTVLIFNKARKLVSWTDHVDPQSFSGGSPITDKYRKMIKQLFKGYEKLDTSYLAKYADRSLRLRDYTLKLDLNYQQVKDGWMQALDYYSDGSIKIKEMKFITENVVAVHGDFDMVLKKNGKKIHTPFSTVFILKDGKIVHWVDHVDRIAMANPK